MKRVLVVVDGTTEGSLALDHALGIATAAPMSELVLLHIRPMAPSWQASPPQYPGHDSLKNPALDRALSKAALAGVACRTRTEEGNASEVVTKVAREENCDLIVWPEPGIGPLARALLMFTGLSANTHINKIISSSPVPVTVVTHSTARGAF